MIIASVVAAPSCLPLPDVRYPSGALELPLRFDPGEVPARALVVPGYDEPSTPDRYDRQTTIRFGVDEPAETIIVAVPGLFGGAMQFAPLARRLVAAVPGLHVWAVDRRANALEDRSSVERVLRTGDVADVVRTFFGSDDTPPSFAQPDRAELAFVKEWDLEVHLRDLDEVILEAARTAPRVILLGHSLGATQVAVYAAWTGGRGPSLLDGLVLVDGAPGRTGAYGLEQGPRVLGFPVILPSREALQSGQARPWRTVGTGGADFARRQGAALLALLAPDEPAPAHASDIPFTNLAFAGRLHDDQYGALRPFQASLGIATNAELDGNLSAFILGGHWSARSASIVGVAPGAERVGWAAGDPRLERTDALEYYALWSDPVSDPSEWYMPTALLLDLAQLPPDLRGLDRFEPMRSVNVPTLAVGSDRGLLRGVESFAGYADQRLGTPFSVTILSGLTHADLLSARDNPLVPLLARWSALVPIGTR